MSWKRAAVIGATGGIGGALSDLLEQRGCTVVRLARRAARSASQIDIENEASVARSAAWCAESGPLDLVIVASGTLQGADYGPEKDWRQISPDAFARYFAINATGPALVAKHFLPLLPRAGRCGFAALSARVGSITDNRLGGWYGYRASKAALNMIVRTAAIELARKRPEAFCIALHPGTVDTSLSQPHQANVPPAQLFSPERCATHLLTVLDKAEPKNSGACVGWDGSVIPP